MECDIKKKKSVSKRVRIDSNFDDFIYTKIIAEHMFNTKLLIIPLSEINV